MSVPSFLLRAALLLVGCAAVLHVGLGLVRDQRRRDRQRRSETALSALAAGLFGSIASGEAASPVQLRGKRDRAALLQTIRALPVDVDGQLLAGLRSLLGTKRLEGQVRRLARSRRWRNRAEAADLQFLVPEDERTNGQQPLSLRQLRVRLLEDPRPEVRLRAVEGLTPRQCRAVAESLVSLLTDPSAEIRNAALHAAATAGASAVAPAIRQLAQTGPEVASVLRLCALVPDVRFLPALTRHAEADNAANRAMAAQALGNALSKTSVPTLHVLLVDPDPSVRAAATTALGRLRHEESAPKLARRLGDPDWVVREAAGAALSHLGGSGELFLRRSLEDPDPFARDMAQRALSLLRPAIPSGNVSSQTHDLVAAAPSKASQ